MVLWGLIALIVLTAGGTALIYRAITVTSQTSEGMARTSEIRTQAATMIRAIGDAQAGERGFLLTGNERFLDAYTDALTTVPRAAANLVALLADDPAQIERVRLLERLFLRWRYDVAQEEIAARRGAPVGYAAASRAAAGEAARLRATVAGYATSRGADTLRGSHDEAVALRDHLTAVLRMTPPALVSADASQAAALLDTLAAAEAGTPPAELVAASVAVERIARQHALAAEAAESTVVTFITGRKSQAAADTIRRAYDALAGAEDDRLASEVAQGRAATRLAEGVAVTIPLILVLVLLLGFYQATGATGALEGIIDASRGLAAGDLGRRVTVRRADEIGQLGLAFNDMAEQIATRDRRSALLRQMSEMLEASASVEDALSVVSRYMHEMLPCAFGAVYLVGASPDAVEMAASWGKDRRHPLPTGFATDDCWALRRNQAHPVDVRHGGVPCRHTAFPPPAATLCLPLTAQGETLGAVLLAADAAGPNGGAETEAPLSGEPIVALARAAGDRAALAIANLRLRESLRAQSIRDPLTGVFNRRYLEETLEREIRRAERAHHPLGLIMFDIDGFKRLNDTFGHETGDAYLRELGVLLRERFRRDDVVCRYGGDEFVVVLPEATLESTLERARLLGESVEALSVTHRGQPLGTSTLSVGVAGFPPHGTTGEALLRSADAALYRAKQNGRARAEVAAL
ncbi:MAG TPA: diguanylate cyclase [bacterium]|nr:diguanylate cyclase [bacterium]